MLAGCWSAAQGAVINVGPGDNYSKIEGAQPGDQVIIAPGTYAFRVYLTAQATPTNPIVIQAQDPSNPPVWDFGTNLVDNAPGDYTGGDKARGAWQFSGAQNYSISGIVFRNCRNSAADCGGIRYYETTSNLYIKDCVFTLNDNGMTGGTQNSQATVEFCEFNANGNTNAPSSAPTHNLYIYGGYFTMRYCFVHDSVQGQNFHIRCRNATLEYNWFARAANYEGDLMSDDDFSGEAGPFQQTLTLRGNVIVQNALPGNHSQVIALYNDAGLSGLTLSLVCLYNTFVGNGGSSAFVHVSNADGTAMSAQISDSIISGTTVATLIGDGAAASVNGVNNWQPSNAAASPLTNTVHSASPGFGNPAAENYHLATGSVCIGAANTSVYGLPGKEYYLNEATNRMWRPRASALDVGAFESTTTSSPVGPYTAAPQPRLNIAPSGPKAVLSWPLFAQDYQLDQSDLGVPVTWTASPLTWVTNGTGLTFTVIADAAQSFYRLQK
ncbi:MAG: hypothetical protein ABSG59_00425 [Verrucomicrobiota bacterium]|jgi:hypothetical protein